MKTILGNVGKIRAGHPFRGAIKEDRDGNGSVIQVKNIDANGIIDCSNLIKTKVFGRGEPGWLRRGDVLFVSRGVKLAAAAINEDLQQTVCSPHFFVISVLENKIIPEFLAWQLNQDDAQRYLSKVAMGSDQLSVTKKDFGALPVSIPNITQQYQILEYASCIRREQQLYQKLIKNREQQLAGVVQKIFNEE